jgi:GntR family transcriptional regulator
LRPDPEERRAPEVGVFDKDVTLDVLTSFVTSRGEDRHQGVIDATVDSTMLNVRIDRADAALLHDQVAADIRQAIAEGEAKPGERLPPAHDLAAVLGVNTNTVLRALRLLRDEGLLEFRRGRGVTVAGGARPKGIVPVKAQELVRVAREQGFRREDLLRLIENLP